MVENNSKNNTWYHVADMHGCDKISRVCWSSCNAINALATFSSIRGTVGVMRDMIKVVDGHGEDIWEENSDNRFVKKWTLILFEHDTVVFTYTKWKDEKSGGACVLVYIVLTRGDILSIISHYLIVLRGDVQEATIIRAHYSRWVGNKERTQEQICIQIPVQRSTKGKNSKTNIGIHSVQPVLKDQRTQSGKKLKITISG